MKYYQYSYRGALFFIAIGVIGICFYRFLPPNLIEVTYKGEGFEVKTTSIGVFFIIVGVLFFIFSLIEHRKEYIKDKEQRRYNGLLSQYKELLTYSGTSITKKEER